MKILQKIGDQQLAPAKITIEQLREENYPLKNSWYTAKEADCYEAKNNDL